MKMRHVYRVVLCTAVLAALAAQPTLAQPGQGGIPVYVEDSPAAQDLGQQAVDLVGQERYGDAARVFQRLIDEYPLKVMEVEPSLYADGRRWAMSQLAANDRLLRAYQRQTEAAAGRALDDAVDALPDTTALQGVVARYGITASGMRASLLLAGVWMERGGIDSAASVLDELASHPNLADRRVVYHQLQCTAGLLTGDAKRAARHREALERVDAKVALRELASLAEQLRRPENVRGYDASEVLPAARLPDSVEVPLWEQPLPVMTALAELPPLPANQRPSSVPGQRQFVLPLVVGNELYVNDGFGVMRVDRNSGHIVWQHVATPDNPVQAAQLLRQNQVMADQRGVAVDGDRLYAILGRTVTHFMNPGVGDNTALVCLDRNTGKVLWERRASAMDPALESALLHGTPIVGNGQVYLAARRVQAANFEVSYVLAVSAVDGSTVWKRYIASAATAYRGQMRGLPPMSYRDGRLYVADQLGAVTCLDAQRGSILWMRVIPSDAAAINPHRGMIRPGGQSSMSVGPPVLTEAGLIVTQPGDGRDPILLDPETGGKIRDLVDGGWSSFDFVYEVDGQILGVGSTVEMFDGKTLKQRWRWALGGNQSASPQGRVAVTEQHVIIPTLERLMVLELRSGKIAKDMPLELPGNVLALQDQLIIVDETSVRSYMTWARAQAHLLEQAAQNPTDPSPALALAHLAERSGKADQVLPAVDLAIEALERRRTDMSPEQIAADPLRQKTYASLLEFVSAGRLKDRVVLASLFNRFESIVALPVEQVAYQLWLGSYLAEGRQYADAAERYQVVLQSEALSEALFEHMGGSRLGGTEARMRLESLAEAAPDRTFYARFDAIASERLKDLLQQPVPDPDALVALARAYPLAEVVGEALARAGELYIAADQPRAAVVQLRRAYDQSRDPALLARVVGMLAGVHEKQHRIAQARLVLQRARRAHPRLMPLRDGEPTAIDAWLSDLTHAGLVSAKLPELHLPLGKTIVQPGQLLVSGFQQPGELPRDAVMTRGRHSVQYRAGAELDVFWDKPVPDGDVDLLWMDEQLALLWVDGWQSFVVFDLETGELAWERISAGEFMQVDRGPGGEELDARQRLQAKQRAEAMQRQMLVQQRAQQQAQQVRVQMQVINGRVVQVQQFGPQRPAGQVGLYRFAVNDTVACMSDHEGNVVAIDWRSGDVLWRSKVDAQAVTQVVMDQQHVAVLAVNGVQRAQMRGHIVVFDALTGERQREINEPNIIQWMGLGGDEMVVFAMPGEVAAAHIAARDVAWRVKMERPMNRPTGEAGTDTLVVFDDEGMATVIDIAGGQIVGRHFPATGTVGGNTASPLVRTDDQWHLLMPSQVVAMAGDGSLLWRDAIQSEGKFLINQAIGRDFVAVVDYETLALGQQQRAGAIRPAAGEHAYTLYLLDRAGGSILDARSIEGLREPLMPNRAMFLDNRLVLSTSSAIIIIPGAAPADDGQ